MVGNNTLERNGEKVKSGLTARDFAKDTEVFSSGLSIKQAGYSAQRSVENTPYAQMLNLSIQSRDNQR